MAEPIDLDAYFERIQWGNPVRQDLDSLSALLRAHMARIPFENLDVLLGRPIRLDLEGLQAKLVRARRGGFCFEHATLFAAVLEALGFRPMRHIARVVLFVPRSAAPRTHMFLTVPLAEGRYVVDPGFGALAPHVPLPLAQDKPVRAGEALHWMARDGDDWALHAQTGAAPVQAWVSPAHEECAVDFEMGNHYASTHRTSPFVQRIMLRALTESGWISVMNRDVTLWHGSTQERTQLPDRPALRALLIEHLGFDLPEIDALRVPSIPDWD